MSDFIFTPKPQYSPVSLVTYCDGPKTYISSGLFSGMYFSGRYAFWIYSDSIYYKSVEEEVVTPPAEGTGLNYFTGLGLAGSESRFSNLTACYDNTLYPVLGLEENGQIWISYNSGISLTGWSGLSPVLYNNTNINFPFGENGPLFSVYKTGVIGCYYTDTGRTNLYLRYISDNFYQENLVFSGLDPGFSLRFLEMAPPYKSPDRNAYSKRIYAFRGEDLVMYISRPHIKYANDNFEDYQIGSHYTIESGYGLWTRLSTLHPSQGYTFFTDGYFYDNLELYTSGTITLVNKGITFFQTGFRSSTVLERTGVKIGTFLNFGPIYGAQDFELYPTGSTQDLLSGLILSINSGVELKSGRFVPSGDF